MTVQHPKPTLSHAYCARRQMPQRDVMAITAQVPTGVGRGRAAVETSTPIMRVVERSAPPAARQAQPCIPCYAIHADTSLQGTRSPQIVHCIQIQSMLVMVSVIPRPNPTLIQASAPDIARRVSLIVAALAALVARRFLGDPRLSVPHRPALDPPHPSARRFDRLMARVAANRLPKPRPPRPRRPTPDTAPSGPAPRRPWLADPHPRARGRRLRLPTRRPARRAGHRRPPRRPPRPPPASFVPSAACSASAPSPQSPRRRSAAPSPRPPAPPHAARPSRRCTRRTPPTARARTGPEAPGHAPAGPPPPAPSPPDQHPA